MSTTKKDDKLMALLSVWGIILVVIGHSGFTSTIIMDKLSFLHKWIYSFHMPLFFFISGYLYSLTNTSFLNIEPKKFLLKKVNRLLVPYFVLGIIIFCIKYLFANLSVAERDFNIQSFLYMFVAPHASNSTMGFLWYLITLFVVFAIVTLLGILNVNLKSTLSCLVVFIISWTLYALLPICEFLNISGVIWYIPFFVLGIIFQTNNYRECVEKMGGVMY